MGTYRREIHRYKLASDKVKKLDCPYCGAKKHWQRYVDTETGQVLPDQHGRCDNASKCGQWVTPKETGFAKMIWQQENGQQTKWKPPRPKPTRQPQPKPETVFIPNEELESTLSGYENNMFIQNLLCRVPFPFELQDVEKVISMYYLGTIKKGYRAGGISFPFIDSNGNIRAVQVKQFDEANHTTGTDFLHSIIEKHHTRNNKPLPEWLKAYNENESKVSCLFGEHFLSRYPHNPIALVEAPKTAIYGTLYFGFPEKPQNFLWLAVYNLSSLTLERCKALQGRDVTLFPDLSKEGRAFELWSNNAMEIQRQMKGTHFTVSDLLEHQAPRQDREQGKDLADYLIKLDWREFRKPERTVDVMPKPLPIETSICETNYFFSEPPEPELINWNEEIETIEHYFQEHGTPSQPIQLNQHTTITNPANFVDSHLQMVKFNNGKPTFLPYLNSLKEYMSYVKQT